MSSLESEEEGPQLFLPPKFFGYLTLIFDEYKEDVCGWAAGNRESQNDVWTTQGHRGRPCNDVCTLLSCVKDVCACDATFFLSFCFFVFFAFVLIRDRPFKN